ncbi:hypothetical protein Vretifemale_1330 [Volvox reticuliferus]|uniref:SF4 helicase domain-containing protein n=1 Tax=Volvox reticuliferus TaxID=1737510 RepID=A0A8J4BVU1_9CHLO|nr:hypothetical protein Vretifemale_1330 [Volvox reticuliferus]
MPLIGYDGFARLIQGYGGPLPSAACLTPSPRASHRSLVFAPKHGSRTAVSSCIPTRMRRPAGPCDVGWQHTRPCRPSSARCGSASALAGVTVTPSGPHLITALRPTPGPLISTASSPSASVAFAAPWSGTVSRHSRRPLATTAAGRGGGSSSLRRSALLVICCATKLGDKRQLSPVKYKCRYCGKAISRSTYEGHHTKTCVRRSEDSCEQRRRVQESVEDLKRLRAAVTEGDNGIGGLAGSDPDPGVWNDDPGASLRSATQDVPASTGRGNGYSGSWPSPGRPLGKAARVRSSPTMSPLPRAPPRHNGASVSYPPPFPPSTTDIPLQGLSVAISDLASEQGAIAADPETQRHDMGNGERGQRGDNGSNAAVVGEHKDWLARISPSAARGEAGERGPGQSSTSIGASTTRSMMPPAEIAPSTQPPAAGTAWLLATSVHPRLPISNHVTSPPSTASASLASSGPSAASGASLSTSPPLPSSQVTPPSARAGATGASARPSAPQMRGWVAPVQQGLNGSPEPSGLVSEPDAILRGQDAAVAGGNGNVMMPGSFGSLSNRMPQTMQGRNMRITREQSGAASQVQGKGKDQEIEPPRLPGTAGSTHGANSPSPQQLHPQPHDRGSPWSASAAHPQPAMPPHQSLATAAGPPGTWLGPNPSPLGSGIGGSPAPAASSGAAWGPLPGPRVPSVALPGQGWGPSQHFPGNAGTAYNNGNSNGVGSSAEAPALMASQMFLDDGQPAIIRPRSGPAGAEASSAAERQLAAIIREGQQTASRKQYRKPKLEPLRWEGYDEEDPYFSSLLPAAREWLMGRRKIPAEVLRRNRIFCTLVPIGGATPPRPAVAFPFFRSDNPDSVAFVKYRLFDPDALEPFARKEFRSSLHGEPIMYGTNDIVAGAYTDVIIVEGEMDKLAMNAAGFWNVVSVPNGAPAATSASPSSPPEQLFVRPGEGHQLRARVKQHYAFMDSFLAVLPDLGRCRFTIATDNDPAGQALRRELLRRLGRERCWEVLSWDNEDQLDAEGSGQGAGRHLASDPFLSPVVGQDVSTSKRPGGAAAPYSSAPPASAASSRGFRKDANDVLVLDGPVQLAAVLEAAQPAKVAGLATFREYEMEIAAYFQRQDPLQLGVTTGWSCLDPFYRVAPGELTIVTGVPNSGKSEWLDALMVNLAENHGWAFALCSMEKQPLPHLKALIEKRVRKPFRPVTRMTPSGPQMVGAMSLEEVVAGFNWLADHFHLIRYDEEDDTGAPTIDWVLQKARTAVLRFGIRGLLIDPYNELDSRRPRDTSETDFIREMLTKVRRFARDTECHVWFVAHPRQQKVLTGQAPGLYDISGSAHWFNKTDNGIVVHRRFEERTHPETGKRYRVALPEVDIKLQKVRNKDIGTQGEAYLLYDKATGRYEDPVALEGVGFVGGSGGGGSPQQGGPQQLSGLDRVQQRNLELGYVFNSGSYYPQQQQQQQPGADNIIDITLGPSAPPLAPPSQAAAITAAAFPAFRPSTPSFVQPSQAQHMYPQTSGAPPGVVAPGAAQNRCNTYLEPVPSVSQPPAIAPPPAVSPTEPVTGEYGHGAAVAAEASLSSRPGAAVGGSVSRVPQRGSPGASKTSPTAGGGSTSSPPATANSRAAKVRASQAGSKEAQGRRQRAAAKPAAKEAGDLDGSFGGGALAELLQKEQAAEARQAFSRDDGSAGGWQPDGSSSEDAEMDGEEATERYAGGMAGAHRRHGARSRRSGAGGKVMVQRGGAWVEEEPERLGALESSLAENAGMI